MYATKRTLNLGSKSPRLGQRPLSSLTRSYADAIDALNSLQTPHDIIEQRRRQGIRPDASSVREMTAYLRRIGYSPRDLDRLNVIHVAGTKGKGTTCAYVDAILARYRQDNGEEQQPRRLPVLGKTGLFLSPHLIAVRERIRIDSAPLSEDLFARYFFDVWDRLGSAGESSEGDEALPPGSRPAYSRYLTLMSWHVFLQESVAAAIYETGIGGEYDATNLVPQPLATGISTLGIDHVFALGDTVGKIAWHKAGILKAGSPAFTTAQVPEAEDVLRKRAEEKGVDLKVLPVDERLRDVQIKPDAEFQRKNATLAIALAEAALVKLNIIETKRDKTLPKEFVEGIEGTAFRGRCEVKEEETVRWHVDGAHTADSLKVSAKWFADEVAGRPGPRVMIFNQQARTEALDFLTSIRDATASSTGQPSFDHVVFCTNVTRAATGYGRDFVNRQHDPDEVRSMAVQHRFAAEWARLDPKAEIKVLPTIEEALNYARGCSEDLKEGNKVQAFVTGSLHLVGGALGILEGADAL